MKNHMVVLIFLLIANNANAELTHQQIIRNLTDIAKNSGMCETLKEIVLFQKTTKMSGSEEFVSRFLEAEAERLGMSVKQLHSWCKKSNDSYAEFVSLNAKLLKEGR